MKLRGPLFAIWLALAACAATCTTTPTPSPQATYGEPNVHCDELLATAECHSIATAALSAVGPSGLPPINLWIRGFTLCGSQNNLFNMKALNCPAPTPPRGGQWRAGVEIAFGGEALHGGVNVAEVGGQYVPRLIGYRVPDAGWCEWLGDCLPNASPS